MSTKLKRIRRSLKSKKKTVFAHLLNYTAPTNAFEEVLQRNKERLLKERKDAECKQVQQLHKQYKQHPASEYSDHEAHPKEFLKSLGIENKTDFRSWMKMFHTDKGGDNKICAKVLDCRKRITT